MKAIKTGLLRNKNAQHGPEKKSVALNVRVTENEKKTWQSQASREGMSLSLWVETVLNTYCERKEKK